MNETQALQVIDKLYFFEDFSPEEKKFLSTLQSDIYHYSANEVIIQEGQTDERHFFIVLRGLVNIVKNTSEVTIAKLKGGAIFGEISYISKRCRTTSAIAGGDVIALKIDSKKIDELNPAVSTKLKNKFIEVLVDRLEAMNKLVNLNI